MSPEVALLHDTWENIKHHVPKKERLNIAEVLIRTFDDNVNISDCIIILPNKRSGFFLKEEINFQINNTIFSPRIYEIDDFMDQEPNVETEFVEMNIDRVCLNMQNFTLERVDLSPLKHFHEAYAQSFCP